MPTTAELPAPPESAATSIAGALAAAIRSLAGGSDSPRLDAEILLGRVLGASRPDLIVRGAQTLSAADAHAFQQLVERRAAGAPVAYLTGTREFWSLELDVTADVLVPRPETERLVELALELMQEHDPLEVLDLGTGSGNVALALASERPRAHITGVDLSARALTVAAANSRRLGLTGIEWRAGSWFEAVAGARFHLIVANPPYVAAGDPALLALSAEPALALSSGPTGLESLQAILDGAAMHLHAGGWLLLEHGSTQAGAVTDLFHRRGFSRVSSHADHGGKSRVTLGTVTSPQQGSL